MSRARIHSRIILPKGKWFTHIEILPRGCAVRMGLGSRRDYLLRMRKRFSEAQCKGAKTAIISEVTTALVYHRKYTIQVLNATLVRGGRRGKRKRSSKYMPAMPVIRKVWEALDFPCAERLHPVLVATAELLARHGEVHMSPEVRLLVGKISRPTLARLLGKSHSTRAPRLSVPPAFPPTHNEVGGSTPRAT